MESLRTRNVIFVDPLRLLWAITELLGQSGVVHRLLALAEPSPAAWSTWTCGRYFHLRDGPTPRLSAGFAGPCPLRKSSSLPASSVTEGNDKHTTSWRIHSLDSCTVPTEYVVYASCSGTAGWIPQWRHRASTMILCGTSFLSTAPRLCTSLCLAIRKSDEVRSMEKYQVSGGLRVIAATTRRRPRRQVPSFVDRTPSASSRGCTPRPR